MDKTFDPSAVEARWRDNWENSGAFKPKAGGDPYCIMIPPPNVTGTLHMGHAFQHTIMDALTRYHRMLGDETLWQPGTDHAGIATQMVVERNLKLAGEPSRAELGRDKFVDKVWEWKAYSGGTIENQIRRMGSSVDWSRNAFTMNPEYSTAVLEHFVRLHEAGLIYRGNRLVNWDPVLQTAISDLEVVSEEENGKLWHFRYPLAAGLTYTTAEGETRNYIVVATTRPETMLGDTAVAVHPEDERYKHLIGKNVVLPLCNREIPIVADDYVDREFGTGCVKITPAHDFNDYALGQRHQLPIINIFTPTALVNDNAPAAYRGLDRFEARKRVFADLEAAGLVDKVDDHKLKVPRGDRTGVVVEPYLTNQWFVDLTRKTLDDGRPGGWTAITEPAIKAVEEGRIKFVPENWSNTYFHWLRNIQDWCISRQLWWGHRIPAWYDEAGNVYVGRNEAEVRQKYPHLQAKDGGMSPALRQDEDVFDTWFSSDIWPIATLGWPQPTPELKKFYPTSVLVTGFDIIFFWVARMVMMGQYFMDGAPPFREVYVHGLIRDSEGQKMSKSKGNVLDPLDLVDGIALEDLVKKRTTGLMKPETAPKIEKATRKDYPKGISAVGVDALRFTFAALASPGRDIRFDAGRAEGYRNFCNKIWNAARFVLMNVGATPDAPPPQSSPTRGAEAKAPLPLWEGPGEGELSVADRWIISRLQKLEAEVGEHLTTYRFDLLAQSLYQFIWNEYCDWYLELTKPALQTGDEAAQRGTRRTLVRVLEAWLRLLHPLMPFLTEEIWQRVAPLAGKVGNTIMLQPYPLSQPEKIDEAAEADVEWLKSFILGVRQIRGEMNISPGKALPVLVQDATPAEIVRIERLRDSACFLAKIESLKIMAAGEAAPYSAVAVLGSTKVLVPMAGLIDKEAELARVGKEITKRQNELAGLEARLADDKFVNGAPAAVIEKQRARIAQLRQELASLREQEARIREL